MIIPNIWERKKWQPNHQPEIHHFWMDPWSCINEGSHLFLSSMKDPPFMKDARLEGENAHMLHVFSWISWISWHNLAPVCWFGDANGTGNVGTWSISEGFWRTWRLQTNRMSVQTHKNMGTKQRNISNKNNKNLQSIIIDQSKMIRTEKRQTPIN